MMDPTHAELMANAEYAEKFKVTVADMAERSKNWTDEQFAGKTVELLIYDEGNLNRYRETLNLVLAVHRQVVDNAHEVMAWRWRPVGAEHWEAWTWIAIEPTWLDRNLFEVEALRK